MTQLRPHSKVDAEAIRVKINCGETIQEIADDLEVSRSTIYRRADALGIPIRGGLPRRPPSIRDVVEDMTKDEAIEFLIAEYDKAVGQRAAARAISRIGLTRAQGVIFGVLARDMGRVVPYKHLVAAYENHTQRPVDPRIISVQVCYMRRRLAGRYTITNQWDAGYMMKPADA